MPRWLANDVTRYLILRSDNAAIEGQKAIRRTQIAIVFRDLVLEDQLIAEGVSGQLGDSPVVLMEILAMVREHEIR